MKTLPPKETNAARRVRQFNNNFAAILAIEFHRQARNLRRDLRRRPPFRCSLRRARMILAGEMWPTTKAVPA